EASADLASVDFGISIALAVSTPWLAAGVPCAACASPERAPVILAITPQPWETITEPGAWRRGEAGAGPAAGATGPSDGVCDLAFMARDSSISSSSFCGRSPPSK